MGGRERQTDIQKVRESANKEEGHNRITGEKKF